MNIAQCKQFNIIIINNFNRNMYNAFIAKRNTFSLEQMKSKHKKTKKYVDRYYQQVRPALLESYNKRINSFIRKMEEEPVKVYADSVSKEIKQKESRFDHGTTFRFKDKEDWNSMFTPLERIQRERNIVLFEEKYGDASIALRSIVSQSQYDPNLGNKFRIRNKSKEINPPMKYTNKIVYKPTKLKKKRNRSEDQKGIKKKQNEESIKRGNTSSSFTINEDEALTLNQSYLRRSDRESDEEQVEKEQIKIEKKKVREERFHFKELVELQVNMKDNKNKKVLRQVLEKCGVYKKKERKTGLEIEVDQLSDFDDK